MSYEHTHNPKTKIDKEICIGESILPSINNLNNNFNTLIPASLGTDQSNQDSSFKIKPYKKNFRERYRQKMRKSEYQL